MMPEFEFILRALLPSYFVAFILVGGPLRVVAYKRRYGVDPLALEDPDPLMEFGERYRDVLLLIVLVMTSVWTFFPHVNDHLGRIPFLDVLPLKVAGAVVLLFSLVVISVAQFQLGESWRFGVDRANPPPTLVTGGLYAFSRNPIYLGLLTTGVGLFLVLPNAVTFVVPNVAYVLLGMRIRLEEAFLAASHGAAFERWRRRTPRWLGWPSREG